MTSPDPGPGSAGRRWGWPVPTWRLVVGAAVGSLVVLVLPVPPPAGLWVVNGALLVAAVVDWLLAVRPDELEVERELPGIVPLGAEARVVWRVAHRAGPGRGASGGGGCGCGWRTSWRRRWGR